MSLFVDLAADVLIGGGVIAYPTEGVFGLGCLPDNASAIARLLHIKHRDPGKGLILIASNPAQLEDWIALPAEQLPAPDASHPITWLVPPGRNAKFSVCGNYDEIAVRLCTNPVASALCEAVDSPIVSTSANLSGRTIARNRYILRRQFGLLVDYLVPGDCGPASGPSEIRSLQTGRVLRQH